MVLSLCHLEASGQFFAVQMSIPHPQSSDLAQSQALVLFEAAQVIQMCSWDGEALILALVRDKPSPVPW